MAASAISEQTTKKDRLISLIEYSQQSVLLRGRPVANIEAHRSFAVFEHEALGLPGVTVNSRGSRGEDEIWLAVDRLHETGAPDVSSAILQPWVVMSDSPDKEPHLRDYTEGENLIAAGTHRPTTAASEENTPPIEPESLVPLAEYIDSGSVRAHFDAYLTARWRPWADSEKRRRKTISLYSQLFTLKQQLEGGFAETQLELVWGIGLGIWNIEGTRVNYPLITQQVELSLNTATAEIEIRPRDVDARIEVDWYAFVNNPGAAALQNAAKEFFRNATTTFSPFDHGTYEPLIRVAVAHLDGNGVYWPSQAAEGDRTLPKPDGKLKVTDTWVLFARPRANSVFIQDLERLKEQAKEAEAYPPSVDAIVTEANASNPVVELPVFRGVSSWSDSREGWTGSNARDLYFPKPFNDEQVRVIQWLDVSAGVVVQGPPGTGKTHTIANVICHYLAEGKRVLVTSMKDPALGVLREHLPEEIRPLAISLLSSEQAGMKQFEYSIQKIASEVQSLDRVGVARTIAHLEERINGLHTRLATIDRRITGWAKRNLDKVRLDSEEIDPMEATREVVARTGQFEWIPDRLGIESEYTPQFSDVDVADLRHARRSLGRDIDYLHATLPAIKEFPDSKTLLQIHQDLSNHEKLRRDVDNGNVPALADSGQETLASAMATLERIKVLRSLRAEVARANRPWTTAMRDRMRSSHDDTMSAMVEVLGVELGHEVTVRKAFLERPVAAPDGIELDTDLVEAIQNLAKGRSAFGLKSLFGKSLQKRKQLDEIRILADHPASAEEWQHVAEYLLLQKRLRGLALRWNALAAELPLEGVQGDRPDGALAAAAQYDLYLKVKATVKAEEDVYGEASRVFPNWHQVSEVAESPELLVDLERYLRHHLTKNRLTDAWSRRERCQKSLEGRDGRVSEDLRLFISGMLGNPDIEDGRLQARWSELMTELQRVLSLDTHLEVVADVCSRVEASGAKQYADLLRQPLVSTVDSLLPDNWREVWRLRRLATYLESIDAHEELKQLAKERQDVAGDLAHSYRAVIISRTWLKLANNASPKIRSALQAYLSAIQRMGKGTGKRAVRYRQDARVAAMEANPAVPCWIMPHYRVSESLPAELGCFDLVIIDEASQSDLTALPSLLRAKKVLIVGDDKQVSPEGVGLEEERIRNLMARFLGKQVETYRQQMSPERSIYDLYKVVFAKSSVMLREHFRCVGPIIEYSKREFYNHELRPLRIPRASERLDPPLVDVLIEGGYRTGEINRPEAQFITDEIKSIVREPQMATRSIGVVSLLGDRQALEIWDRLTKEVGPELILRHQIACGDARMFQGKERDIMFLSMVSAPNDLGAPLSRDAFAQRFNVAASRAKDRMYLVRSVGLENLSQADRLRRSLIEHFASPFVQDELHVESLRRLCQSDFERDMYDELTQRGYWVTPQVQAGHYRIDFVVEGHNDTRLAVECDGDKYHGPEKWADDIQRQRVLERAGWVFWRCFASAFYRRRDQVLQDLLSTLAEHGIEPIGADNAPRSLHTELRVISQSIEPTNPHDLLTGHTSRGAGTSLLPLWAEVASSSSDVISVPQAQSSPSLQEARDLDPGPSDATPVSMLDSGLSLSTYNEYSGPRGQDPRTSSMESVAEGLCRIVETEGPMLAKRAYDVYLRSCGIQRMGRELRSAMNKALTHAIRKERLVSEDESGKGGLLYSVIRVRGTSPILLRTRGPRSFEEIPPSELQAVAVHLTETLGLTPGSDEHLRAILDCFGLKRLTAQVGLTLLEILGRSIPYVDKAVDET